MPVPLPRGAIKMAANTCEAVAKGEIYDQLGVGFALLCGF
jgi:uncharacterized protein YyaL (SSP411 family)